MSKYTCTGKVIDICPNCKNCKGATRESNGVHVWLTEVECEDPFDGVVKTLDADSDICCSMFELKKEKEPFHLNMPREAIKTIAKLNDIICELEKEKAAHLKGIERLKKSQEKLQNQVKNLQTTNEESYKREEKLEDKVRKLERRLLEESKRRASLDTEFLIPLAHVLYPREAKICKPYSEVLKDIKLLNKGVYDLEEDCKRLADKNKALFEENIDRLDKHTKQCQEIDNLKNELKKANELADSWKRDYERLRDQFVHPIYNILYPDNPNLDINVTDLLNYVKDLKVYADENGRMYKEVQEWREKCIARGKDIDHLLSENKEKDKKIGELESSCTEKHAEISKLQNIVTEKEVEIRGLRKDNVYLNQNKLFGDEAMKKNTKLNQTISDQEITIKALLITIKEMCKEDETNE